MLTRNCDFITQDVNLLYISILKIVSQLKIPNCEL